MKLNKENYELVMFDMLEGNLPEKEALQAMKQIEADEFFFKEWNLFKSTVLAPELNYTYTKKDTLLKKETRIVPMGWWLATAAACLVAGVLIFNPPQIEDSAIAESEVVEKPIEETVIDRIEPKIDVVADVPLGDFEDGKLLEKANPNELIDYKAAVKESVVLEKKDSEIQIVELPFEKPPVLGQQVENNIANNLETKVPDLQNENKVEQPIAVVEQIYVPFIKKMQTLVTSHPKDRIREKGNAFLAMLQNPKIKVRTQFENNKPGFQIELETQGYQAIASIQPFNKNRN